MNDESQERGWRISLSVDSDSLESIRDLLPRILSVFVQVVLIRRRVRVFHEYEVKWR